MWNKVIVRNKNITDFKIKSGNNFHSFSYTEQGQKIVLYLKNTLA